MANIKYSYVHEETSPIAAYREVLLLKTFQGVNTKIYRAEDDIIYINDVDIDQGYSNFDEHILEIFKDDKVFNIEFFGVVTGKEVLTTEFCEEDFVFFVFSAYHRSLGRWCSYDEIIQYQSGNLRVLPKIGVCPNDYLSLRERMRDSTDTYGFLMKPYPDNYTDKSGADILCQYLNPLYQEDRTKEVIPSFAVKDLKALLEIYIDKKFFRQILVLFCLDRQFPDLEHLKWEDLKDIQEFIFEELPKRRELSERVSQHRRLFDVMVRLRVREWFLDFLKISLV